MITDKDLEKLENFSLDKKGWYTDMEDYAIIPVSKARNIWDFCYYDCVDGSVELITRLEKNITMEEFGELFYNITLEELSFKAE